MYLAVSINSGGYIHTENPFGNVMVHRETVNLHRDHLCSPGQGDLRYKCRAIPKGRRAMGIAQLREDGGVEAIWVPESQKDEWTELLKIWKGCYGTWPVHTWKEEAA